MLARSMDKTATVVDRIKPKQEPDDEPNLGRESFLTNLPKHHRERMALMTLRPKELVLAFADGSVDDVVTTLMNMENWEDLTPAVDGQYAFALKMQLQHAAGLTELAQQVAGVEVTIDAYDAALRSTLEKLTPSTHRDAVLAMFDALAAKTEAEHEPPMLDADDIASVIIVAAQTANMLHDTRAWPSYPTVRTNLLREIKDLQGIALGAPPAETITTVSYDAAIDRLESIINPPGMRVWTLPRDPKRWGLNEIDMIETIKAHMLQYPDPTPEQNEQLRGQIKDILDRTDEYFPPETAEPARTGPPKPRERRPQRTQPKRKQRAKRKKRK